MCRKDDAASDRKVNSLTNNYISQLALSPDGKRVYVATTMGVCALDMATESWLTTFRHQLSELRYAGASGLRV